MIEEIYCSCLSFVRVTLGSLQSLACGKAQFSHPRGTETHRCHKQTIINHTGVALPILARLLEHCSSQLFRAQNVAVCNVILSLRLAEYQERGVLMAFDLL